MPHKQMAAIVGRRKRVRKTNQIRTARHAHRRTNTKGGEVVNIIQDNISVDTVSMNIYTDDALSSNIRRTIDVIPFGRSNAISTASLCAMLGVSERKLREHIEQARRLGEIIINHQDGRGYFRTDDINEIERQYRKDTRFAMSLLKRRRAMRRLLKDAGRRV